MMAIGQIMRCHEAIKQHVVGGESVGPAPRQHGERLVVILADDDLDTEVLFVRDRPHRRLVGGAGGEYQRRDDHLDQA
jgi:hypothetical protein